MEGYIARDPNGTLRFHFIKPEKKVFNYFIDGQNSWWISDKRSFIIYDNDFNDFKGLTSQDTPKKVNLLII